MADSQRSFFAWKTVAGRRQSTDVSVLNDPLVAEAYSSGYRRGWRDGFTETAVFADAIATLRRAAERLEGLDLEYEAVQTFAEEVQPYGRTDRAGASGGDAAADA